MGCSDSNAMQNHLHVPQRQKFTHNPHEFPSPATDLSQKTNQFALNSEIKNLHAETQLVKKSSSYNHDSFQNSQEYLEQLYSLCEGNLQKFFSELQQKISEIYMTISKDTLEQMNQNVLINNESKIQISEEILWFNLNILKVASRKSAHKFNSSIFKQINKLQKNLVGYLKMKYPRGGQSFVPGDLMAVFKEFDITEDVQFDILKNSDTYFGSQTDENLSKDIKIFLNKLMTQLDIQYPRFEKIMQEQVFVVQGELGQKRTLSYKIGRKIPENVSKYTDLDNNTLEINSPQIFRVIIKWMEYLEEVLVAPNENINKKKNFKCFIEQNEKGQNIFDEINEDQYYDLINFQLVDKIEKEKINYHDQNENLLKDMDRFNSHLIKLLDTSIRKQKFVPLREMETIKYSNLNAKFIAWVLGEKIMLALKKLIKIGKSFYKSKAMLNLDLIQFKVTDLMRSMVSGSKKQILAVYENLKKLEKQGTIKIIKIKNRLGTSLNDAMIIFAMKDTPLICQIQLILSDSTQKVNQKYKNIELLNHFFYELERSPYGILSEIAVLLAYKDSKMAYQNSITFELNQIDFSTCEKTHPNTVLEIKMQTKPFLCTKCTKFYFKFQNIFLMKHCETCNMFICGKCIFENDKQLQNSIVNRQIAAEIERAVTKTLTKLRTISSSTGAASILQIFSSPFKRLQEIFGPKQLQVSKLIDYLNSKVKNVQEDLYFVIISFRTGKAIFKGLVYKPAWKQIQNPFNQKQVFSDKKKLSYTSYDLILFYDPNVFKKDSKEYFYSPQENMLHLFASEEQVYKICDPKLELFIAVLTLGDFKLVINVQKLPKEKKDTNVSNQRQDNSWKDWKNKCTKTFKYKSIHEATEGLPDLQGAKSILKLSDLGIQNVHLTFFKQINWAVTIKQLKLSKNNLSNIALVLENCVSIQRLYVNENFIKQLVFGKQLSKIEIINAANNQIYLIQQVKNVQNIAKLLLQGNKLEDFPKCTFPNLKILSLKRNPVKDFSNVYKSSFPNLQQLYLDYEEPNQNSYYRPNDEVNIENVILPFQKLKSLQSESNFTSIQILSKKIERVTLYRNQLKEIIFTHLDNLKYVTLSNNNIESLDFLFNTKNNFENNSIEEIDVQKNFISTLPIIKSTSLNKLNIKQNKILQINSLTESSIPNIQNINLEQNQIKQLPEISFPKLAILNLAQNPIQKISQLQNSKLQSLQKIELSNCGNIDSFPLLSLKSLIEIDLSWTQVDSMENLSQSQLPTLKKIMLNYCTINHFPVINLESLEYLDLSNSTIQQLSNLQKSKLNNLKGLILSYVQLLDSVEIATIQYDIINQNLQHSNHIAKSPQSLQDRFTCKFNFPKLQELRIDGSNFRDITGLEKSNLPKLQELSMQTCCINAYPKLTMKSLKALHATTCQIENLESLLSPHLESLEKIYLSGNIIQKIHLNLPQIKVLDVSVNRLVEFTHANGLDELIELNLESNRLQKLPIIKAKNLKQLLISGNPLTDISQLEFCSLPSLEELRLSNCDLSNSPFPKVNLESVKSIYMTDNQIKDISSLFIANLPVLEDINFSYNQITSIPVLKLPELKFLRLNVNQITDISNLQLSQCPELTIIELQENMITSLPLMPFPNLAKIFIDKNDVTDVSKFNKSPIKKLTILNICNSNNLEEFPMLQCKFQELYASQTKLFQVIRINEYKGLTKLHLNGNQITHIPIINQKEIQMMQFQDNLLTNIDEFAQGDYPNCTLLSFKGNQITTLPLLKMEKLQKIYLNQNLLENIDNFLQSNMPYLQLLTVQDNKLKSIKKLPFPNLTEFYVTRNLELQELNFFNLPQYQQLTMLVADSTAISKVQVLPKMPALQKIWVSNSKLQDIEWFKKSASNLPKLHFANFSNNQIKKLPALRLEGLIQFYFNSNPVQNMDQFLSVQKRYLDAFTVCYISLKMNDHEQFLLRQSKIASQHRNFNMSHYSS